MNAKIAKFTQKRLKLPHLLLKLHLLTTKFNAKFFDFFARLFILLYFRSENFRTVFSFAHLFSK